MSDVLEGQAGKMLAAFDGRVFEVFGFNNPVRYHRNELELEVKGPDKKGRYEVKIGSRWRGMAQFWVEGSEWPAIAPVIEAASAAARPPV